MADISLTQAAVIKNLLGRNEGRITMVSGVVGEDSVWLYSGENKLGISFISFSRGMFLQVKITEKLKKGSSLYFEHGPIRTKVDLLLAGTKYTNYLQYLTVLHDIPLTSLVQNPTLSINVEKDGQFINYDFRPGIQYDDPFQGGLLLRNMARQVAETRAMLY